MSATRSQAVFGGGCFWCLDAIFQQVKGVIDVRPGFAGGTLANPSYEQVCTGTTGHAEVLRIEFDADKVSYETLVRLFFHIHNPTTLNRQGADAGTQYRSIILFHDEKQKLLAEKAKLEAQQNFKQPIVTEIVPFKKFFKAEDYHQGYYDANSSQPYCQVVIMPKLEKLEYKKVIEPTVQTPK